MKKLVNGKVIDIQNIKLFEMAAEGTAKRSTTVSNTSDGIPNNMNSSVIQSIIKCYDIFFKAMPYPLYAIEDDIKYATLANFIKAVVNSNLNYWVNEGLYIQVDKNTRMTLHIVNNTWSIVYTKCMDDNTSMELFKNKIGYNDYSWLLSKILKRENFNNYSYYETFMPDFLSACNYNDVVIKWELDNILTFGNIPKKIELVDNKIIDITKNCEYTLDTYVTGKIESDEKITTWDLTRDDKITSLTSGKMIKTYGYDVYTKSLSSDAYRNAKTSDKLSKTSLPGMQSLFLIITGVKNAHDKKNFPVYQGFISDTNLIFSVDRSLYISKANIVTEAKEIARGIDIYGIDRNNIYFVKDKKISDNIIKESLYSYNLSDNSIKICSIKFKY